MGIGGGRWRRVVFASWLPQGADFSHLGEAKTGDGEGIKQKGDGEKRR